MASSDQLASSLTKVNSDRLFNEYVDAARRGDLHMFQTMINFQDDEEVEIP